MGKSWTEEQQQVINLRGRSLLVSAAAGSGKTAVLVERIIQKITDAAHPIDIDELLVVTFTKAAAAEMRERVMAAVDAKLLADPENSHLQKQKMLLPSAMITTIDSFCMSVLREHFDKIGLDPGFRVGDPQEMALLKQDVAEQLLEDCYMEKTPEFTAFSQIYSIGKLDKGLSDWILRIYDFSQSYPWPEEWLGNSLRMNPGAMEANADSSPVVRLVMEESRRILAEMAGNLKIALDMSVGAGGPALYEPMLLFDLEQIDEMLECKNYEDLYDHIQHMEWKRLSGKKQPEADASVTDTVKILRQEAKDLLGWLKKNYFSENLSELLSREQRILPSLTVLIKLTEEFSRRFREEKRQRNLIDFNDQEHFALNILLDEDHKPTPAARSYSEQFEEIMCDEYQDSNQVQETLLNSISREREGHPNIFMVGDVKQSIYRFRMAEPEIFLEKYRTYTKDAGSHQRIDLHKNFRSRACVLESVNRIFESLMTPDICGMDYDEDAALYPGLEYPETELNVSRQSEWLMVEHGNDPEMTKREAEARAVGLRIRELMDPSSGLWVMDTESGEYRRVEYGDIVILLRTVKNWTEDYVRVLKDMGIPAVGETSSGFFDTLEIQGILNMLRILDNPLQDIPMAAVLTSSMGGLSDEELAEVRILDRSVHLYKNMQDYLIQGENRALAEKLQDFFDLYDRLRGQKVHRSIEELIYEIYGMTGYVQQMFAMPGGEVRRANLERLAEYARAFKNTSYRGLFHFIRYVDQLKESKEDLGSAVLPGEAGQAVRIMSIHKSKGLEYPVCFVAGLGKSMNFTESRSRIVVHARYGVAADGVDLEHRVKIHSLSKKVFARKLLSEQMGEEVRVLYVAMTRAREKLILVGTVEDMAKADEKWTAAGRAPVPLTYSRMLRAKSYLDWLGPLLWSDGRDGAGRGFEFRCINPGHMAAEDIREEIQTDREREFLQNCVSVHEDCRVLYERIDSKLGWQYPRALMTELQGKMTVSELKKMAGEEMTGELLYPEKLSELLPDMGNPLYMAQQKGTATHKIFELLPFSEIASKEDVISFIHCCVEKEQIPAFWEELIPTDKVFDFCRSELGQRMIRAEKAGRLYRERPFVMGIPVSDVYPELLTASPAEKEEQILIQGVIDVFFEEDDGIVLLDYKTDRIPKGTAGDELLIKRYKTQLDYYQKAIEQIIGKKVKDRILYSVIMNREIHC
ncbi:helicase-exonuclease AddAB subunit AddA [Frisingicoccus sp.]|uniref:helicase-exonuclease AddAB subunit AddA n=1 Tax=Frisingicoccus sp. TaxID=1918627 RepID=UPI003AB7EB98